MIDMRMLKRAFNSSNHWCVVVSTVVIVLGGSATYLIVAMASIFDLGRPWLGGAMLAAPLLALIGCGIWHVAKEYRVIADTERLRRESGRP